MSSSLVEADEVVTPFPAVTTLHCSIPFLLAFKFPSCLISPQRASIQVSFYALNPPPPSAAIFPANPQILHETPHKRASTPSPLFSQYPKHASPNRRPHHPPAFPTDKMNKSLPPYPSESEIHPGGKHLISREAGTSSPAGTFRKGLLAFRLTWGIALGQELSDRIRGS